MSDDLNRLKKICNYGYYVLAAFSVILVIVLALLALTGIIMVFFPDAVDIDDIIITGVGDIVMTKGIIAVICWFAAAMIVVAIATLVILMRVMKAIRDEYTPFTKENVDRLRQLSILYVISPIVFVLIYLAVPDVMSGISSMIVGSLLVATLTYCVSLIFRYGMILQKESDETL